MDYKELARGLSVISKYEKRREYNEINVGNVMEQASTAITALLHRAEAAESAHEALQRTVAEYKARAEKAEHDMKRIVNRSSYPCEYCTKEKCFATDMKRQCYDFTWDSGKKEE